MVNEIEAKAPPAINPDLFYFPFSPEYVEQYLLSVYVGSVTKSSLSLSYHNEIINILESAMTIGFDKSYESMNYTSAEREVFDKMRKNIYQFSAAKQYQQVRTMSQYINFKGEKSTWPEFRRLADIVFENYNKTYLKTEWITSVGQSQMAKDWVIADENKDIIPYLMYRTQRDARVRDEHAILDGITLPVGHKFWDTYMPKKRMAVPVFYSQQATGEGY